MQGQTVNHVHEICYDVRFYERAQDWKLVNIELAFRVPMSAIIVIQVMLVWYN